jgi:hypothetical protein
LIERACFLADLGVEQITDDALGLDYPSGIALAKSGGSYDIEGLPTGSTRLLSDRGRIPPHSVDFSQPHFQVDELRQKQSVVPAWLAAGDCRCVLGDQPLELRRIIDAALAKAPGGNEIMHVR